MLKAQSAQFVARCVSNRSNNYCDSKPKQLLRNLESSGSQNSAIFIEKISTLVSHPSNNYRLPVNQIFHI